MLRLRRTLLIILGWVIVTSLYAYYYAASILAHRDEYDAYAMSWGFQLMMFAIFRLPYLVLILIIIIGVVLSLPSKKASDIK